MWHRGQTWFGGSIHGIGPAGRGFKTGQWQFSGSLFVLVDLIWDHSISNQKTRRSFFSLDMAFDMLKFCFNWLISLFFTVELIENDESLLLSGLKVLTSVWWCHLIGRVGWETCHFQLICDVTLVSESEMTDGRGLNYFSFSLTSYWMIDRGILRELQSTGS